MTRNLTSMQTADAPIISDLELDEYADQYRDECFRQGNDVLMRQGMLVPFEQFLRDRIAASDALFFLARRRRKYGSIQYLDHWNYNGSIL